MPSLADQIFECFSTGEPLARRDLPPLSCHDSMGRSLGQLVRDGRLVRVGRGCYRRATGGEKPVAHVPLAVLIARFMDQSNQIVFLRRDFAALGDSSAAGRALSAMVKNGHLIRLGRGLYAQSVHLQNEDGPTPIRPVTELIAESARRLGMMIIASPPEDGEPGQAKGYRISRRIGYGENFAFLGV